MSSRMTASHVAQSRWTMSNELTCVAVDDAGLVEQYVAGTLPSDRTVDFELHLFTCARCREEVRLGTAIRLAARDSVAPTARRRAPRIVWFAAAAAAAFAAALVTLRPRQDSSAIRRLGELTQPPI